MAKSLVATTSTRSLSPFPPSSVLWPLHSPWGSISPYQTWYPPVKLVIGCLCISYRFPMIFYLNALCRLCNPNRSTERMRVLGRERRGHEHFHRAMGSRIAWNGLKNFRCSLVQAKPDENFHPIAENIYVTIELSFKLEKLNFLPLIRRRNTHQAGMGEIVASHG